MEARDFNLPADFGKGQDIDDETFKTLNAGLAYGQGFKAGIKEVVKWMWLHHTKTTETPSGRKALGIYVPLKIWQAKLKEWGIE